MIQVIEFGQPGRTNPFFFKRTRLPDNARLLCINKLDINIHADFAACESNPVEIHSGTLSWWVTKLDFLCVLLSSEDQDGQHRLIVDIYSDSVTISWTGLDVFLARE